MVVGAKMSIPRLDQGASAKILKFLTTGNGQACYDAHGNAVHPRTLIIMKALEQPGMPHMCHNEQKTHRAENSARKINGY